MPVLNRIADFAPEMTGWRQDLHRHFAIAHATIQVETGDPCPQAPAHVV